MGFIDDVITFGFAASGAERTDDAQAVYAASWTEIEALYVARRGVILRSLGRLGVEPQDAEDILQESFLRLYAQILQEKRPNNSYQWLMYTARNLAVDWHRKRRREEPGLESALMGRPLEIQDRAQDIESDLAGRERAMLLRESLRELAGVQRTCLFWRIHGLTFREIAAALKIPERVAIYQTGLAIQSVRNRLKIPQ